jgi:hypothetical protein
VPDRILAVRALVERLSRQGLDTYDFEAPLSERAVASFEKRHGITLPEEYRRFVTEVSAGGRPTRLGPPHLITPTIAARLVKRDGGRLAAPFPLTNADAKRVMRAAVRCAPDAIRPAIGRDISDGVLPIKELGGGDLDFLVVSGPQRGCIWQVWEWGWSPLWHRVRGELRQYSFFSWLRATL